jgi:hypothetical protein
MNWGVMDRLQASREGSRRRRWLASLGAAVAAALLAAASAQGQAGHLARTRSPQLAVSGGGQIAAADGLAPGDRVTRRIVVANTGPTAVVVTLDRRIERERPGAGGGLLSRRLVIEIRCASGRRALYSGTLSAMPRVALGTQPPGARTACVVGLRFPSGDGDNAYQGAGLGLRLRWTAVAQAR